MPARTRPEASGYPPSLLRIETLRKVMLLPPSIRLRYSITLAILQASCCKR